MSRRKFLHLFPLLGAPTLLAGGFATACAPPAPPTPLAGPPLRSPVAARRKLRAICFDLFTLFDPRGVIEAATALLGEQAPAFCEAWRGRQFEYSWLRVAADQYVDFEVVTREALLFTAASRGVTLSESARRTLIGAYSRLTPWPDAESSLQAWKRAGLQLAPLSNYSPSMLEQLLRHAGFSELFTLQLSTDLAKTFKPDPRAYALAESRLGLSREEVAFAAFGGWDAAGAKWFGFPTFWLNRLHVPHEQLVEPDATGPTLAELNDFVQRW